MEIKWSIQINEIYAELKENMFSFVKLYRLTKKEGMTQQQVIDASKIAEEIPNLQAERRHIEDCIDEDGTKIFELKRQKESLSKELRSILEEIESVGEYRNNQLKSIQEELDLAKEHANNELKVEKEKLDRQKASLASEVDKYKEFLANEVATAQEHTINELNNSKVCLLKVRDADYQLKFIQKEVYKLKQEEQQLTSRIERLENEERLELSVQRSRSHPQPVPNLLEEEQRKLAIRAICNNWESNWDGLMHRGVPRPLIPARI